MASLMLVQPLSHLDNVDPLPRTPNPPPVETAHHVTYSDDPICDAFGPYCAEAKAVVACESGGSTTAVNGQYLGMFQMGEYERATYGHGDTATEQAQAAFRYFSVTGFDWSPWACKP